MSEERALVGGKEISEYLRWSLSKLKSRSKEMKEAGVLFIELYGIPTKRQRQYYTFPSLLQRYLIEKNRGK